MKDRIRISVGQNNEYMEELLKYIDRNNKSKEEEMIKQYEEEQWGREVMESDSLDKEVEIDMYDRRGSESGNKLRKLADDGIDYSKTYKEIYLDNKKVPLYEDILWDILGSLVEVYSAEDEEYFKSDGETERNYDAYTLYEGKVIFEAPFDSVTIGQDSEDEMEDLENYTDSKDGDKKVEEWVIDTVDLNTKENVELYYEFNVSYSDKVFRLEVKYSYTETDDEAAWHDTADRWEDDRY